MANLSPSTSHLKATQWQSGQSGNPSGNYKGTRHLSSRIQDMLDDDNFLYTFKDGTVFKGRPIEAILRALILKAMDGDMRAFELLAKYGYGTRVDIQTAQQGVPILPIMGGLSQFHEVK